MIDVAASYETPFLPFLGIFIHYCRPLMSEVLYIHQTSTDCVSNQYTHIDILICQTSIIFWKVQEMYGKLVNLCNDSWLRQSSFLYQQSSPANSCFFFHISYSFQFLYIYKSNLYSRLEIRA